MCNALDIQTLYRLSFPDQTKSSLKHMTEQLLEFEVCKTEQLSNWAQRPLRKAQIHYGAADAFLPLLIKSKLCDLSARLFDLNLCAKNLLINVIEFAIKEVRYLV